MAGTLTPRNREVPAATEAWNLLDHWRRYDATLSAPIPVASRAEADAIVSAITTAGGVPTAARPVVVLRSDLAYVQEIYADGAWKVGDTDWVDLELVQLWAPGGSFTPQVRVKNGIVYYRGRLKKDSAGAGTQWAFNVPTWARPDMSAQYPSASNTSVTFMIDINVDGTGSVYQSAPTAAWRSLDAVRYPIG